MNVHWRVVKEILEGTGASRPCMQLEWRCQLPARDTSVSPLYLGVAFEFLEPAFQLSSASGNEEHSDYLVVST